MLRQRRAELRLLRRSEQRRGSRAGLGTGVGLCATLPWLPEPQVLSRARQSLHHDHFARRLLPRRPPAPRGRAHRIAPRGLLRLRVGERLRGRLGDSIRIAAAGRAPAGIGGRGNFTGYAAGKVLRQVIGYVFGKGETVDGRVARHAWLRAR